MKKVYSSIRANINKCRSAILFFGLILMAGLSEVKASAPIIVSSNPSSGDSGVPISTTVVLNFNENIKFVGASSSIQLQSSSGNISVSASISSGTTLTLTPNSTLLTSTTYTLNIPAGILADLFDNNFPGSSSISFTTSSNSDGTPPTITGYDPTPSTGGHPITGNIVITFSENIVIADDTEIRLYFNTSPISWVGSTNTVTNNVLTINPNINLFNGGTYFITIGTGAITDVAGNSFAGINSSTDYRFTTVVGTPTDSSPPGITGRSPSNNATNVAINSNVEITFSENVFILNSEAEDLHVQLRLVSDNTEVPSVKTINNNILSFDPISNLANNTSYYVWITGSPIGAIRDLAGNSFTGLTSNSAYRLTTVTLDTSPPSISNRNPAINANNVAVKSDVVITFNESISLTDASEVELRLSSNNVEVASSKTVDGQTLTINPNNDLSYSTAYHIFIADGAIQDQANNDFGGIADLAYGFTTTAPPNSTPTSLYLSSNEIQENAGNNAEVGTLSTEDPDMGDTHSYMLVPGIGDSDNASFDIITDRLVAKSSFDFETPPNTYSVRVRTTDAGGLFTEEIFSISVTNDVSDDPPIDGTPPGVTLQDPAHNSFDHPIGDNIEVTFNEDVRIGDPNDIFITRAVGNVVLSVSTSISGGNKLIIDPDVDLEPGFLYRVTIVQDGIEDLAGNDFAGYSGSDYEFGTPSNSAPTNITLSPTSIQENNSIDDVIGLLTSFDANTGDNHTYSIIPILGSTDHLSFYTDGNQLVADAIFDFETKTSFRINIETDDGNGGTFQKEFDIAITNDTSDDPVSDTTKPTVNDRRPAIDATNVALDSDVVITFSEDIVVVGDVFLFDGQNQVVSTTVSTDGAVLTLDPMSDLDPNETHKVSILSNVIRDAANNFFDGISFGSYNFTTAPPVDVTAPTATLSPTDDADNVPVDANFTLTFSEDVRFINPAATTESLFLRIGTGELEGFTPADLTLVNNVLTVDPTNDLTPGQSYNIRIFNNLIEDLSDNPYAGFSDQTSWNFTAAKLNQTIDFDPLADKLTTDEPFSLNATASSMLPVTYSSDNLSVATVVNNVVTILGVGTANITASQAGNGTYSAAPDVIRELRVTLGDEVAPTAILSPVDDAMNVPIDANFTLTFNEDVRFINPAATSESLFLRIGVGELEGFTPADLTLVNNVLTVDPTNDLTPGQSYNIRIFNNLIEDLSDNPYAGFSDQTSWNFTAAKLDQTIDFDPLADKLTTDDPFSLNATASSMLSVTYFSDNLSVATVVNNVVTIQGVGTANITASQAGNGTYNAAPDVVQELRVTLGDEVAPLATLSPVDDAMNVPVDANFTLTFNEDVRFINPAATTESLFLRIGVGELEGFTPADLTLVNNVLTVDPTNDLTPGQSYNIRIFNNLIEDLSDNPYAGFSDQTSWNFTAAKLDQTIDFDPIATRTYGDASFDLVESASSGLIINYTSTNTNVATVTNRTVTIVGAGTAEIVANQGGNFTYNSAMEKRQTLTVNKRTITATAENKTKAYGDINPTLTIDYDGLVNGDNPGVIDIDPNISTAADEATDVGTYDITLENGEDNNYQFTLVNGTLDITKRTITATAESKTKTYGDTNPTLTIDYDGLVNGDSPNEIDVDPNVNTSADETSDVGSYAITLENGSDNNYLFNLEGGTLQVTKRTLVATAEDKSRTFGEANPELTIDYDGFVNGDTETGLSNVPSISTTADALSNAGTYDIILENGDDNNYEFDLRNGTLTILKADQTITIDPIDNKEITASPFSANASVDSGLPLNYDILSGPATISGNTITLSGSTGTVIVEVTQGGDLNYNPTSETVLFNVVDPSLTDQTITFGALEDKSFGDAPFDLIATSSSGLTVNFEVLSGPVALDVNELTITGTGFVEIRASQPGNAIFNPAPVVVQSFTINRADQTISFDPIPDKLTTDSPFDLVAFSSSGLPLTYAISGPATLSGTTITLDGTPGTVEITAQQSGNENYNQTNAQISFEVSEPVIVNNRPSDISLSSTRIEENLAIGALVGEFNSSDADPNDQHIYSLVTGDGDDDNDSFSLSGNQLLSAEVFDFEIKDTYSIRVRSDDQNGGTFEKSFSITIDDVSENVVTSIGDELKIELQVYPNPSIHIVHIETGISTSGYIEIFNLNGHIVVQQQFDGHEIELDVSGLIHGIYILKVAQNERVETVRLIVGN